MTKKPLKWKKLSKNLWYSHHTNTGKNICKALRNVLEKDIKDKQPEEQVTTNNLLTTKIGNTTN